MANYSVAVKGLIDQFRESYAEESFTDDLAKTIWGGKGGKVKDMSDHAILQFLLLDAHAQYAELVTKLGQATTEKLTLNREQRRKLERTRR